MTEVINYLIVLLIMMLALIMIADYIMYIYDCVLNLLRVSLGQYRRRKANQDE